MARVARAHADRGRRCRCSAPRVRRSRRSPRRRRSTARRRIRRASRSSSGVKPVTTVFMRSVAPARRAYASSPSRTSRALFDSGNSFDDSVSSTSGRRSSSSKKSDLLSQRPGAEHLAQQVRRRIGDEARFVEAHRQHVAASAAADEDLAAAVARALEQSGLGAGLRGEDRGHGAGRARTDDDDAPRRMWGERRHCAQS